MNRKKWLIGCIAAWVLIMLISVYTVLRPQGVPKPKTPDIHLAYSDFINLAHAGKIADAYVEENSFSGTTTDGKHYKSLAPIVDSALIADLLKQKIRVEVGNAANTGEASTATVSTNGNSVFLGDSFVTTTFWLLLTPLLLLVGGMVIYIFTRPASAPKRVRRGSGSDSKSLARMTRKEDNRVRFTDVAGCDEAKQEVAEVVEFLQAPSRYQQLGGKIPTGVLMVGAPGAGKTLLAKAIAGEAGVPFFELSGSDFVEMYVGVGAARVRDLFATARENAPCIIFIDEIDAVGRQRGSRGDGGNDEREQTLNQLLVEMDGFGDSSNIIIIAATNRPDILDKALLRPGRFDRHVTVNLPDIRGREQILRVHTKKIPLGADVDIRAIARSTPGFSGADLANLVNEAALFAARHFKKYVERMEFEMARDKIAMGAERKNAVIPEEDRRNTAWHEAGHALVALSIPGTDPVHKVTIIPRGQALGVMMQLPETDRYSMHHKEMLANIAILFGGRVAEELYTHDISTGASNDIERATRIATDMVTRYGMSPALGPLCYGEAEDGYLGAGAARVRAVSEHTMRLIDGEIRAIVEAQYEVARRILREGEDKLCAMVDALMEWETLDAVQLEEIMRGEKPRPPAPSGAAPVYGLAEASDEASATAEAAPVLAGERK